MFHKTFVSRNVSNVCFSFSFVSVSPGVPSTRDSLMISRGFFCIDVDDLEATVDQRIPLFNAKSNAVARFSIWFLPAVLLALRVMAVEPAPASEVLNVPIATAEQFRTQVDALQRLADAGDVNAMYQLGSRYASAQGVVRDPARAATWRATDRATLPMTHDERAAGGSSRAVA
jgi:hypothetical protein